MRSRGKSIGVLGRIEAVAASALKARAINNYLVTGITQNP